MNEYEEGEACDYTDNSFVDPDTDLSYIDEKLQNVLGHFQKDFEGGVSAENLGTKFGGYGSFLPAYQRSPLIRSHTKNPTVQNFSSPDSPNVLPMEGTPLAKTQFTRLGGAPQIASSPCISDKNVQRLSSDQGKKLPVKNEPVLNKQVNSSDQRTLKVRIKLNSDNAAKSKNAIYSGFGLNTTPSSSMGNSEDSSGIPSQCAGTMNESPSNILQIMTAFAVPDGSLLSPLVRSLLCLEMKENISQISSSPKAAKKVPKEKKRRVVVKKENTAISNGEIGLSICDTTIPLKPELDVKVENNESEIQTQGKNPNHMCRNKNGADMAPLCNLVERNVSRKKMEVSKSSMEERSLGTVKDESLESISDHNGCTFDKLVYENSSIEKMSERKSIIFCKDESVNVSRSIQSKRNGRYAISKADSDVSNCSRDVKDEFEVARSVEKSSFQGKHKAIGRQNSVDLVSEISGSLEVPKRKKKSAEVDSVKLEDDNKIVNCKSIQLKTTKKLAKNDLHNLPEGSLSKSNRGVVEKKQGSSLIKSRMSTQKDIKACLASNISLKESENGADLSQQVEVVSMVEQNIAEPLVIEEDWVQCDRCETWRLLPYGTNAQQLPEKWVCRMLDWLPGMNRCDISEDVTTQALHRLYQTENQSNFTKNVDKIYLGSSAEVDHLNTSSNYTVTPQNTKPKLKETRSNGGSVVIPGSVKNFQQDVVKIRSLNDMSSKFSEEKNALKHKEKHEKIGEKKLKNKRTADPCEYVTPKRTKVDVTSGAVKTIKKVQNTGILEGEIVKNELLDIKTYDEREVSLKKRKLKDWQESQKHDGNHHNKRKEVIKEETCDSEFRKIKNPALSNAEKNEFIVHKSDEKIRSIDKVNRDFGSEQCSKPANSSSSKVSNSLKNRSQFLEVKGSPVESVSSSPIRISNLEQISPSRRRKLRKNSSKNGQFLMDSAKKSSNSEKTTQINQSGSVKKVKVSGISYSESTLDFRDNNKSQKLGGKFKVGEEYPDKYMSVHLVKNEPEKLESCHDDDKSKFVSNKDLNNDGSLFREKSRKVSSLPSKGKDGSSGNKNSERIKKVNVRPIEIIQNSKESMRDSRDLKCRIKLVKDNTDDKMTTRTQIQSFNNGVEVKSDLTREKGSSSLLVSNYLVPKVPSSISSPHKENEFNMVPADSSCCGDSSKVTKQCNNSPNLRRSDASSQSSAAFEEAEQAKAYADRLKDSGFPLEANDAYLKAILYFLHAASVRENCNYDSNKHGEVSPMQMYSSTAKLSELCAIEYEKRNDLANAALAYKCMEVAYFRVVYCKNATMNRDRHDLQATLQNVPLGESPSSSASDVDSLNNQLMVDNKSAISKTVGSHAGNNHIIVARNRPAIVRLLDCMKEVNSAMEASNKSQDTYAAACQKIGQNNAGIISVKKAIDLSFQDVDEVVRLLRIAIDLISRQGISNGNIPCLESLDVNNSKIEKLCDMCIMACIGEDEPIFSPMSYFSPPICDV